jgi:hypothetical protein
MLFSGFPHSTISGQETNKKMADRLMLKGDGRHPHPSYLPAFGSHEGHFIIRKEPRPSSISLFVSHILFFMKYIDMLTSGC